MGADKQECHVLQCVRNVWELVTAIHHRLRTIECVTGECELHV